MGVRPPALSAEEREEANKLYDEGWTYKALAEKFMVDVDSVKKYIKNKRPKKRVFVMQEEIDELNRQYSEERKTYTELAKIYGVSTVTIGKHIKNPRHL
jgi:DNA-directed RNA polymerase specialized sigma24 family protein